MGGRRRLPHHVSNVPCQKLPQCLIFSSSFKIKVRNYAVARDCTCSPAGCIVAGGVAGEYHHNSKKPFKIRPPQVRNIQRLLSHSSGSSSSTWMSCLSLYLLCVSHSALVWPGITASSSGKSLRGLVVCPPPTRVGMMSLLHPSC